MADSGVAKQEVHDLQLELIRQEMAAGFNELRQLFAGHQTDVAGIAARQEKDREALTKLREEFIEFKVKTRIVLAIVGASSTGVGVAISKLL